MQGKEKELIGFRQLPSSPERFREIQRLAGDCSAIASLESKGFKYYSIDCIDEPVPDEYLLRFSSARHKPLDSVDKTMQEFLFKASIALNFPILYMTHSGLREEWNNKVRLKTKSFVVGDMIVQFQEVRSSSQLTDIFNSIVSMYYVFFMSSRPSSDLENKRYKTYSDIGVSFDSFVVPIYDDDSYLIAVKNINPQDIGFIVF